MLRVFSHSGALALALIAVLATPGFFARADEAKPVAPPGYKLVPVKAGGRTAYIQVKDTSNMYGGLRDGNSDKNTPEQIGFGATSSMANKTYLPEGASAREDAYQDKVQGSFITKSYFSDKGGNADDAMPGLHSTVPLKSAEGYDISASGFDRSFDAARSSDEQNRRANIGTKTAGESGRTAVLGGHEVTKFAYADSAKAYAGPEEALIKRDLDRMNNGLESMKDLPNRPLTIDEVRALINNGVKPDLDEKPPEPSKPLNDPNYMPDPAPPARGPINLKDDDGDVPPPGTMAHPEAAIPPPENSQPLPQ